MPPCHGGGRGFESRPVRLRFSITRSGSGFFYFYSIFYSISNIITRYIRYLTFWLKIKKLKFWVKIYQTLCLSNLFLIHFKDFSHCILIHLRHTIQLYSFGRSYLPSATRYSVRDLLFFLV